MAHQSYSDIDTMYAAIEAETSRRLEQSPTWNSLEFDEVAAKNRVYHEIARQVTYEYFRTHHDEVGKLLSECNKLAQQPLL